MKSPLVRWLIALNLLVLCGALVAFFGQQHHQQQVQQARQAQINQMVRAGWKNDDATPGEQARLQTASQAVQTEGRLTDDQFSFLLTQVSKPNTKGVASGSHLAAVMTLDNIKAPLPASQKAILYNRLLPLLQIPDPTVGSGITLTQMHKLEACDLLAKFDVREAVPQIVPLLDDPKPQVRINAKRTLKKLGYST